MILINRGTEMKKLVFSLLLILSINSFADEFRDLQIESIGKVALTTKENFTVKFNEKYTSDFLEMNPHLKGIEFDVALFGTESESPIFQFVGCFAKNGDTNLNSGSVMNYLFVDVLKESSVSRTGLETVRKYKRYLNQKKIAK